MARPGEVRPHPLGGGGRQLTSVGPASHAQGHMVATTTSGAYSVAPAADGLLHKQFADPGEYYTLTSSCTVDQSF